MPLTTYRMWLGTAQRSSSNAELETYLASGTTTEGWTTEFKAAARDPDFGVREAVAALANALGGEVFLGVDNTGVVRGSPTTLEALNEVLRQARVAHAPWRITDLLQVVPYVTPVPLATPGLTAYVVEVRPYDLPSFVLDSGNRLVLPVRSGSDTKTLDAATAIEWYLVRRRSDVLRACYQELSVFALQLSQFRWLDDGLPDPLPYIQSIVQDGTAYRILTPSDRSALFGRGITNGRSGGAVDCYYKAVRRIRATLAKLPITERNVPVSQLPGVGVEFSNLEDEARRSVRDFGVYLQSQGISIP